MNTERTKWDTGVEKVEIEETDRGFVLNLMVDQIPEVSESGWIAVNIQGVAEALYDQAKSHIGPWLYERDMAKGMAKIHAYEQGMAERGMPSRELAMFDADAGYALDDPKHPTYHERMSGLWDNRAGK